MAEHRWLSEVLCDCEDGARELAGCAIDRLTDYQLQEAQLRLSACSAELALAVGRIAKTLIDRRERARSEHK